MGISLVQSLSLSALSVRFSSDLSESMGKVPWRGSMIKFSAAPRSDKGAG